jgi:acyl-CoA thioester hydrolase
MSDGPAFRYPVAVRFFEVDALDVVFNMWYLGWCDEAENAFLEHRGYRYRDLNDGGLDAVLRKADVEWFDSLHAFELAEIEVRVEHLGTTSFRLGYDIRRVRDASGADMDVLCAHVSITYVCVTSADKAKTPIPVELRAALEKDQGR